MLRPGPSNSESEHLRRKYLPNTEIAEDKSPDFRLESSEMNDLRYSSTSFGKINEASDDHVILNKDTRSRISYSLSNGATNHY